MYKLKNSLIVSILALVMATASAPVYPLQDGIHRLRTPLGDIAFEVVGQLTNPSPDTSHQYGYLSLIRGLKAEQIFTTSNPAAQNQTTALFTFFTDAVTQRVIVNGPQRVVNRVGTTTIYFDETPDGDFSNRDTFRDGTPILVLDHRQQIINDSASNTVTVMNLNTVTSAETFELGGERFRLGREGDRFRVHYRGANNIAPPPNGFFAGYAVTIEPRLRLH